MSKGTYKGHIPCSKCGSSDGLAVYQEPDGSENGYCWVCKTYYTKDTLLGIPEAKRKARVSSFARKCSIQEIEDNSYIGDIPDRGIRKEVCEKYGVRVSLSPVTGEIEKHYYPRYRDNKLVGYKERSVADKVFKVHQSETSNELFGQQLCGSNGKMLIITEGECDALAAYQMLLDKGKNYRICSLPDGANAKSIAESLAWVETFENVFLAFDQDEPGQAAAKKVAEMLTPGKARMMSFSGKDPNDLLLAKKGDAFFNSIFNASAHKPDGIVGVDDIFEDAIKPVQWGLSWPWPTLTKATYGFRRGEIYGIGAASGAGKTEWEKELINHIIHEHNLPVGVIFLEEPVSKTLKVLAGKHLNKRFHIPDGDWTLEELIDGINSLKGKVYLYNHFGAKDWANIKQKIRYMVRVLNIKDIVLDHLTALVAQETDEYKALNKIMEEMASLTQELDCTIFYVSHLRKANGTPHEEGGHVSADQFKGSGAIVYWSNFLFGIERNQIAEDPDIRNTSTFRVLKDRNTGLSTGTCFKLWYDHTTGRWREKQETDGLDEL